MAKKKKKRTIVRVKWDKKRGKRGMWHLTATGPNLSAFYVRKTDAVCMGRHAARGRKPSQLMIHLKSGRFQTEHTYGDDPRRSKG